jgi:predicted nucleotidyltransferase
VPGIEEAFLYGSYARDEERAASDLDLFVIGRVDQALLSERLGDVERDLGREVNVASYERNELEQLRQAGDLFVERVLEGTQVPLIPALGPA